MAAPRPHVRLVTSAEEPTAPMAPPVDLEQAFRQYGRYVAHIGTRLLGRSADVDDLVQDVFLDAWRGMKSLREPAAIKGWLATVTVRKARRRLRRRAMLRALGFDAGLSTDVVDETASAGTRALIADLYRVLDSLPTDERIAWTLRHLEGESLEDVARLCGCSLATAKRRIAAAHTRMETDMEGGS